MKTKQIAAVGILIVTAMTILIQARLSWAEDDSIDSYLKKLGDPTVSAKDLIAGVRRLLREDAELRRQLNARVAPVGTVVAFAGQKVPSGWRLCNGDPIDRASHPEFEALFSAIGYTWGGKDNIFKVPDLRGRFLRGVDGGAGVDPEGSIHVLGTSQEWSTAMPRRPFAVTNSGNHSHGINFETTAGRSDGRVGNTVAFPFVGPRRAATDNDGSHGHPVVGGDPETRPANAAVNWIIKYIE